MNLRRRKDTVSSPQSTSNFIITSTDATIGAAVILTSKSSPEIELPGRGEINNVAAWDDFPNGRFGDYKSPAFGAQDQWGGLGLSVNTPLTLFLHSSLLFCRSILFMQTGDTPKQLKS